MSVYTVGVWRTKDGSAAAFQQAWTELAQRTKAEFAGAEGTATLLQDRSDANLFISFGAWPSVEAVDQWRASAIFGEGVGRIRELCESFTPHSLDPVAVV